MERIRGRAYLGRGSWEVVESVERWEAVTSWRARSPYIGGGADLSGAGGRSSGWNGAPTADELGGQLRVGLE